MKGKIYSHTIPTEIQKWLGLKQPVKSLTNKDFLFIDVETSGEYIGAGVICFLVGIGQLVADEIHLAQYLILHSEDEFAHFLELEKMILSASGIMTYNGKSFDLPVLRSRFQFHQIPFPTGDLLHIDLLHLSRKIWKNHLRSRTLRMMEANLLDIERSLDDVPGWMISSIYRNFLLSQDVSVLTPALYHNKMDVVSIVHLYLHIIGLFNHPLDCSPENAETIFHLANFYQSIGEPIRAIDAYLACQAWITEPQKVILLENLALLYKKLKLYEEAHKTWQEAASLGSLNAHLELAKYYKQIKKDPTMARLWVEAAIHILDTKKMDRFERSKWQAELQYYLEKLRYSKLSKNSGKERP